ncbi:acid-sensing ion channel 4-like [Amphibalanus amphitrite]|uniref:acid-sensing ion channel 4-like n=1 Tax=Amphibalanus amphitrite TaxID=1232801 RepID=UPI001C919FC6|nr:acid-sensing ion channel 4-like [Amphibalanus amphitrite]
MTWVRIWPGPQAAPPAASRGCTVSVPGVSVLLDRRAHGLRRALWALVLAAALVIFVLELLLSVQRLLEADVTRSWSHSSADQLEFPAVTVCALGGLKPSAVARWTRDNTTQADWFFHGLELLRWQSIDLERFLDEASYTWEEQVVRCTLAGQPCAAAGRVSHPFSQMLGQCHTLTAGGPVPRAHMLPQLRLQLAETDRAAVAAGHPGWLVALHPAHVRWSDTAAVLGVASVLVVPPQVISQFTVKRTRLRRLSSEQAPCDAHTSAADVLDCHDACQWSEAGGDACRLRWLAHQPADTAACTSYEQFLAATSHRRLFLNISGSSETAMLHAVAECSRCRPSCAADMYVVQSRDRLQLSAAGTVSGQGVNAEVLIQLLAELEDVVEKYDYTFNTLISDIGGIAGLLLGASVLTLVELLDGLASARCRCRRD